MQKPPLPPLAEDAIHLMESHFPFLSGIDHLSALLAVSKPHLIRSFSACTGMSPGQYLTQVRLRHARHLLTAAPELSLEAIAGACGYACANYFSKVFRKHSGMTPRAYGRKQREVPVDQADNDALLRQIYL